MQRDIKGLIVGCMVVHGMVGSVVVHGMVGSAVVHGMVGCVMAHGMVRCMVVHECHLAGLRRIGHGISRVRQARLGGPLETCENHWNSLCFQHGHLLLRRNGFQKKERFLGILQKPWKMKQKSQFPSKERLRFTSRAPWRSCAEGRVSMRTC